MQADTIVPEPGNPQDLNRYAYGRNNPIKYTDPTGNSAFAVGAIAGVLIGGGYGYGSQVAANLRQGMSLRDALTTDIDATKVAKYASAGLLIGATLGAATDAAVAAVSIYEATAAAQVGTAVTTAACADGDPFNEIQAASQAVKGGLNATSWQQAEKLLGQALNLPKNTLHFFEQSMSTYRIPDFVDLANGFIADSKWVQHLKMSQQLRDLAALAQQRGVELILYVRQGTVVDPSVIDLVGGLENIIRIFE